MPLMTRIITSEVVTMRMHDPLARIALGSVAAL